MYAKLNTRLPRLFMSVVPCLVLAGCFGTGDGPESIPGTPAPPVTTPPGFCDDINFETACPGVSFADFGGGQTAVIVNDRKEGINTSDRVAQMVKTAGEVFGGTTIDRPAGITFTDGEVFKMKVLASRNVPVLFKFEGLDKERELNHTGSDTWEELCFDFSGDTAGSAVTGITLIFDNGVNGDAANNPDDWTFLFDDIAQVDSCSGGGSGPFPIDFEDDPASYDFGPAGGFGGGASDVIANPDATGLNTSTQTARMQKFAGEVFGGSTLALGGNVDFSAGEVFKLKVWATRAVPLTFKFEGLDKERILSHSGSGMWEELCFDFTADTAGSASNAITFIFDNGVNGDATNNPGDWVFYYDELEQDASCSGGGGTGPLPVDFEADPASYDFGMAGGFGGGASDVIANPDQTGLNTTAQTARMQKFPGEVFGGSTLALGGNVDFSAGPVFKAKVWATRAVPLTFKFEGLNKERIVSHSGSGTWEELCFDFTADTAGSPSNAITFIFDNGVNGDATNNPGDWTFYFDEIEQAADCGGPIATFPVDFQADPASYDFGPAGGFGGGASDVITNPDQTGLNTTTQTARMQKFPGDLFGGSTLALDGRVDFSAGEVFKAKVWATRAVPLTFKFEGLGKERIVSHSGSGTWEELCFDFTGDTAGSQSTAITFIFDNGVNGDATNNPGDWTFYYDELEQVADCSSGGAPTAAIDFESPTTGAGFTWGVFENDDNPPLEIIANPDASGINTSATVAKFTARVAGATFAGTNTNDLPTFTLDDTNKIVKIMVWKPVISDVGIKFEKPDGMGIASTGEIRVANTVVNQWEELTFDFSAVIGNPANVDIVGLVVFPDFDARAQENVIYFDNISFSGSGGGGGGSAAPTSFDFEPGSPATLSDFDGGASAFVANPDNTGINTSATVVQLQKFAGAVFAGSTIGLGGDIDFSAGEAYQVKVYATRAVEVLFKLEGLNVERTASHGGTGWEVLCFDFTGSTTGSASNAITFIFDNGTVGDANNNPDDWTFYVDDVEQTASCGGGGTSVLPIDFEADPTSYVFRDGGGFGGGQGDVVANPDTGGLNTSAQAARVQKFADQPFGGVTLDLGGTFDLAANSAFTIKVRATRVVPVLFKLEGAPTQEVTVSHGGTGWEELCFDFGANTSTGVSGLTFIFENGVNGAAATEPDNWTFYVDDITLVSSCPTGGGTMTSLLPIDFEADPTSYVFRDGGGFGGGQADVVANPDTAGLNTSAQAGRMQKFADQPFGGATLDLGGTFDLLADATAFTMKVRATRVVPVLFKLEGAPTQEVTVSHGGTGWEELCFDFGTNISNGVGGITLIFENGVNGAAATEPDNWTFYFDDIALATSCSTGGGGGGSTVLVNGDFEDNGGSLDGWTTGLFDDVGGGLGSIAADSSGQGGRTGTVARLIVDGSTTSFNDAVISQEGLGAGTVTAGNTITVTFDVYGTVTQPGAAVFAEVIFLNASGQDEGGRNFLNGDPTPLSPTTTWTPVTGTVTAGTGFVANPNGGPWDVSGGLVLSLKVSCGPVDGCAQDISFDNVTFTIN